jgi:hypothetical protein
MPGSPTIERALHAQFNGITLRGEWFENGGSIAAFIHEQKMREACPKRTGSRF